MKYYIPTKNIFRLVLVLFGQSKNNIVFVDCFDYTLHRPKSVFALKNKTPSSKKKSNVISKMNKKFYID